VVFFVHFLKTFRAEKRREQEALVKDPWKMASWMENVPDADNRQLRHMILYLLFPDEFERIFGRTNRIKLIRAFTDMTRAQVFEMSALETNQEIQRIRREAEKKHPGESLDFYRPPLGDVWRDQRVIEPKSPEAVDSFDEYTREVTSKHVLLALAEIDRDDFPKKARSSTYDLIHGDNRYPPKYVLSLACKHATGHEFPRQFFHGGQESKAFRLLESLGFHIEIKTFVRELVSKFLEQADEEVNLAVSEYPKEYRGLKVNVSFGKGNFARIPWISFTGYQQTTQEGVYPVVLYYKSTGRLIVSYGLSETNKPKDAWQDLGNAQTISAYFNDSLGETPNRYGKSFVYKAFDLSEGLDLAAIEAEIDELVDRSGDLAAKQATRLYLLKAVRQVCSNLGMRETSPPRYEVPRDVASRILLRVASPDRGEIAFALSFDGVHSEAEPGRCLTDLNKLSSFLSATYGIDTSFRETSERPDPELTPGKRRELPGDCGAAATA